MSMTDATLARLDDLRWKAPDQWNVAAAAFLAGYREPTRSHHATNLKQWFAWCEMRNLNPMEVERAQIEVYGRWMEEVKGLKVSTVANQLGTIGRFYHHCLLDKFLSYNPAEYVKKPSVPRVSSTLALTRTELLAVLDAGQRSRPRDHALVCILGLNGPRIGEVLQMDISDVGRQGGYMTIRVQREKGGETPIIPLPPRTSWAFDQHLGTRTSGPLFRMRWGERMDRKAANRIVQKVVKKAGITKRITPHSLRHTFMTLALDSGVSVRDCTNSMGYSDTRMVSYYDHGRDSLPRHASHSVAAFVEGS